MKKSPLRGGIIDALTGREMELHCHLLTAAPVSEIAATMGISEPSVRLYSTRIYEKLCVDGRVGLMANEIEQLREQRAM